MAERQMQRRRNLVVRVLLRALLLKEATGSNPVVRIYGSLVKWLRRCSFTA